MAELDGKTILVVDDNKTINRQITAILAKHGAKVVQAINGAEAIEKAADLPDLILMDVQMPEVNGLEATRTIKSSSSLAAIPILLLTGNKEKEDVEEGMQSGAYAYLTKPASGKVIVQSILDALGLAPPTE